MSDYLKEILSKKNLINILILAILLLAVPLTINLVRQQQILFSKAATDSVQLVDNDCTTVANGKKVLTCPKVTLKFVSPSEVGVITQSLVKKAYAAQSCVYSEQDQNGVNCYSGVCSDPNNCGFNNNCAYDPDTSVQTTCPGQTAPSQPSCSSDLEYCDTNLNRMVHKTGGVYAPQRSINEDNRKDYPCVYAYIDTGKACPSTGTSPTGNPTCSIGKVCGSACGAGGVGVCDECGGGWCSGGTCATCPVSGEGTPAATTAPTAAPTQASAPTVSLTVSPNPVTKNASGSWPDLTLQVSTDPITQWGVFYLNNGTCSLSSCLLEGWTPIGNRGAGNASLVWSSAQTTNIPAGHHTFAVFNQNVTQVLAVADVNFTEAQATAAPTGFAATKVWYGENRSDLTNPNARHEVAYTTGGTVPIDIPLSPSLGTKFIFAQFVDAAGNTKDGNPSPFQIDLIGPTPTVSAFACDLDITPNSSVSKSSDILLKFTGSNFGATQGNGTVNLTNGGSLTIDSWNNTQVVARLTNPPVSQTAVGTQYLATLTNASGQKSTEQNCKVGITQISLGAKLFCRAQRSFDQDNVELILALDKNHTQKSKEKVTIDKDGNIANIQTKLKLGENYIACIKAPLSLRRCSAPFAASGGTNNLVINLPIGDINGDGSINNVDRTLLGSQWGAVNSSKNCDVNRDGQCNSFEWSCMLHDNFPSTDQAAP